MPTPNQVVVFDDASTSLSTVYVASAVAAVQEVGFEPQTFDELDEAERFLLDADEYVRAMICSLGSKTMGSFSGQYPAKPLLTQAHSKDIPIALISGSLYAHHYVKTNRFTDTGGKDIVVPKQPSERITPILAGWLSRRLTTM